MRPPPPPRPISSSVCVGAPGQACSLYAPVSIMTSCFASFSRLLRTVLTFRRAGGIASYRNFVIFSPNVLTVRRGVKLVQASAARIQACAKILNQWYQYEGHILSGVSNAVISPNGACAVFGVAKRHVHRVRVYFLCVFPPILCFALVLGACRVFDPFNVAVPPSSYSR